MKSWGFAIGSAKIKVDENLPNYFSALRVRHIEWILSEDDYTKKNYGFHFLSHVEQNKLKSAEIYKKNIVGCPFYLVLDNPDYANDF
jgi:hypothetical protein